jgi:hypothetical protein
MRLTYDEFCKLPLQYLFGYSAEDHGLRQHANQQHSIARQIYTPRKISSGEWGKGEVTFMMIDTGEVFDSARDLWERKYLTPWYVGQAPVRPGWYETDRGMLFWTGHTGWVRDIDTEIQVLPPQRWRGMADVEVKT